MRGPVSAPALPTSKILAMFTPGDPQLMDLIWDLRKSTEDQQRPGWLGKLVDVQREHHPAVLAWLSACCTALAEIAHSVQHFIPSSLGHMDLTTVHNSKASHPAIRQDCCLSVISRPCLRVIEALSAVLCAIWRAGLAWSLLRPSGQQAALHICQGAVATSRATV